MILNKNIRAWIGSNRFLKEMRKVDRKREVISFEDADTIGILYDATDERDSDTIKNYVKNVRLNFKKEIFAIGYVDKNAVGKTQYAQVGLDFFTKKDLNFSMKPSNNIINNFINEEFDILINLNSGKCYPLKYISAMSRARFRVGRFSSSNSIYFDMMVKLSGDPPLKIVIDEIEHFLRLIKRK
jgi:hypothetical protein